MSHPPARPAERYGDRTPRERARRRRAVVAGTAALLAAGVGYAAWYGLSSVGGVSVDPRGYERVDEGVLRVTFSVTRPVGTALVCQVEALSSSATQVGLVSVPVPASQQPTDVVTADVPVAERATTGQPVGCEPA